MNFYYDQIENLQELIQQYVSQISGLEKERDFYYQKLRDVEMICQEPEYESLPHIQRILEILYATEVRKIVSINALALVLVLFFIYVNNLS